MWSAEADQLLRCPKFGFTYKVIFGWVDRTADMQQDESLPDQSTNAAPTNPTSGTSDSRSRQAQPLLRPSWPFSSVLPCAGETINSAAVIVAEPLADYHGIKSAADYFGPISELNEQRGFKVDNEPYAFSVGGKASWLAPTSAKTAASSPCGKARW